MEIENVFDKPKIIMLCGPTAIGKTSVAIELAESLCGEIVNADSMQIFRHMDIGTAKPSAEERERAIHHMINIADPDEPYDAACYSRDARLAVDPILGRGRVPLVAGGTGLYIKSFLYGICGAAPEDKSIRYRLQTEWFQAGKENLYRRLQACDPQAAEKIHPNDSYRIIRALEVFEASGISMTEFRSRHGFADTPYNVLKIGLRMERQILYERIDLRVDQMIEQGFRDEVDRLLCQGYHENLKPMQALGYRHIAGYLKGKTDWGTAVSILKRDTRHYAKRQLTWFRKDKEINWFNPNETDRIVGCASQFLNP